jgi:prepilin-type N-terminal cleavage/methylation domain-containing protein
MRLRAMRGFSLVEMMVVVAIALIMIGITFMSLQPALRDARINTAYDTALTQLRIARERAIAERTRYIVAFGANVPPLAAAGVPAPDAQSIQLWHWAVATPVSPPPALIKSVELPYDVNFQAVAGLPNPGPDNWGTGAVALDFDELGNSNSGILYLSRAGVLPSSKAVTVFGTTGRVRGWRLNGAAWIEQ